MPLPDRTLDRGKQAFSAKGAGGDDARALGHIKGLLPHNIDERVRANGVRYQGAETLPIDGKSAAGGDGALTCETQEI